MEEKKKTKSADQNVEKVKKLSYEELENAANQIMAQFDGLRKENAVLKSQVQQLKLNDIYTELNFRFKVIENAKAFDPNFVEYCVNSIQEIMIPKRDIEESDKEE